MKLFQTIPNKNIKEFAVMILPSFILLAGKSMAFAVMANTKHKTIPVNLLISPLYEEAYNKTHGPLAGDLNAIAASVENSFNNSVMAKKNGYTVKFDLRMPKENPLILKLNNPEYCEGDVRSIGTLLNEINENDNTNHYIAFLMCPPLVFADLFASVGLDIPIISDSINVECATRTTVFFEKSFYHMLSSFGNALMKTLDAPKFSLASLKQKNNGDKGLQALFELPDSVVSQVLESVCFLKQ